MGKDAAIEGKKEKAKPFVIVYGERQRDPYEPLKINLVNISELESGSTIS